MQPTAFTALAALSVSLAVTSAALAQSSRPLLDTFDSFSRNWQILEPQAEWEVRDGVVTVVRADGPPWHTIGLHSLTRPLASPSAFHLSVDTALSENSPSRHVGLVFNHSSEDTFYLFRFNLPGTIQLVRYDGSSATVALSNENLRIFRPDEWVRLQVRSDAPGSFLWTIDTASGRSSAGRAQDPNPLPPGYAGLYTNAPRYPDRPAAFFDHFAFTHDYRRAPLPSLPGMASLPPSLTP